MKKIISISAAVIIALLGLYYFFYGNYSTDPSTNQSASSSSVKTKHKHKHKNKTNSSSSSSSSEVSNAYANELSTQDWYMLAYIDQWHLTVDEVYNNFTPILGYRSSPRAAIDTGTVDSECLLHGITATTVTVAPSSGEGAWSTYKDVTLTKQHLLSYVHSRADITKLNTIISRGLQKAQQDQREAESAEKAANNSSQFNDTETSDTSESN